MYIIRCDDVYGLSESEIQELRVDISTALSNYLTQTDICDMYLHSRLVSSGSIKYTFSVWDIKRFVCTLKHLEILTGAEYWERLKAENDNNELKSFN